MISKFFLDIVFGLVNGLFSILPGFSWSVDNAVFDGAVDFIQMIAYLLPWDTVTTILELIVYLTLFRIVVAIIKAIWDLLPFV